MSTPKEINLAALEVETVPDYYHSPSEKFLVKNQAGRWLPHSAGSLKRILAARGVKTKAGQGEPLSSADLEILAIQNENDVTGYGPLCGRNAGFIEEGGTRFLVTEDMPLITPAKGKFPTITAIIRGLFCDSETEEGIADAQVHTFLGWHKSGAEALRAGRQQQQQALAICGIEDCGKSLAQHHITTPVLGGRSADAKLYFLRGNDFNADLFKAEHLFLDDCKSSISTRDRVEFGTKLKEHTVGASTKSYHSKGKDAFNVKPWWRITITLNDDAESMMVLPPFNDNVESKIILLRASRFDFLDPIQSPDDKDQLAAKIRSEIPAFLYYLLHEYEIPEKYADPRRYNIRTFHHPVLREALDGLSPEAELLDLIDLAFSEDFKSYDKIQELAAAKIEERITYADKRRADRLFHYSNSCGSFLGRLAKKHPDRVEYVRTASLRTWTIFRPQ